jgi:recombination protein RecT
VASPAARAVPKEYDMSRTDLSLLEGTVYGCRDTFEAVLSDKAIVFEREAGFAIQLLSASDYAMGIARSNPQSVINAVTNIAAIGISLNPAGKLAYLVPRDNAIKLDISYMGLMHIAIASGSVCWAQAKLVHQHDVFKPRGFDRPPLHEYEPFGNRGAVVGVYSVAKLPNGDYLTDIMKLEEVCEIRDRSSAWKAWIAKKKSCPWVTDPGEMARKTVVKRAYKFWPKTPRLDEAVHHLNTDGGEGLDGIVNAGSLPRPPAPPAIADDLLARANAAADGGRAAFSKWWAAASGGKGGERDRLRPHIEDLKKRVLVADAKATPGNDIDPQHQEAA